MIADFIMNIVYSLLNGFNNLLSPAPDPPEYLDKLYDIIIGFNYFVPIVEVVSLLGLYIGFQTVRYIWRVIRLFLPGG